MKLYDILESLCLCQAPSGFETGVHPAARGMLSTLTDFVDTDVLGNIVAVRSCGKPGAKRLLLDAHLDEIGLMVTGIENGYLSFTEIGGVDPRMLPGREVTILTPQTPLFGVVACLPPHVISDDDRDSSVPLEELRIDIGMNQEQAVQAVPIGTPIVYREGVSRLAGDRVCGKSLDDRACFAVLLRTLELLKDEALDVDLVVMGSVQEEVSGDGAVVGTQSVMPELCVAVDVTFARSPGISEDEVPTLLGKGPAIGIGPNMTRSLSDLLMACAKAGDIPYQLEVMEGSTGTNAWGMQICLEGIPTAVVSLPLKYMHSPIEVVSLEDMEHTARLLAAFVKDLGRAVE